VPWESIVRIVTTQARRIQEWSADFPVRSIVQKRGVAEFFGAVERSRIAADWKVRAPFCKISYANVELPCDERQRCRKSGFVLSFCLHLFAILFRSPPELPAPDQAKRWRQKHPTANTREFKGMVGRVIA